MSSRRFLVITAVGRPTTVRCAVKRRWRVHGRGGCHDGALCGETTVGCVKAGGVKRRCGLGCNVRLCAEEHNPAF